jgi:DNA-directed RNA polymerase subunit RPC12/RpoP
MVDFRMTLTHDAQEIAFAERQQMEALKRELAKVEEKRAQLQSKLDSATQANARLDNYAPLKDGEYLCPRCWIRRSRESVLAPQSSGSDEERYRCRECGYEAGHKI